MQRPLPRRQLHQHPAGGFDIGQTRISGFDRARSSVEQADAERLFQLANLLRQSRLGNVQRLCRAREATVISNRQQIPQMP